MPLQDLVPLPKCACAQSAAHDGRITALRRKRNPLGLLPPARKNQRGNPMNSCQKYFSVCALALLTQAAFAQSAPSLGSASSFTVLSAAPNGGGAVTCTNSSVSGDVGSSGLPASIVQTTCAITGAIVAPVSSGVVSDFNTAYDALAASKCDRVLTTLDGQVLSPGVYCVEAAATSTGSVLTLAGSSSDTWLFKIGTGGTGALTGTNFSVVAQSGSALACNQVYWQVAQAVTMTDSQFVGTVLAGAAITVTRGTLNGDLLSKAAVTLTGTAVTGCENSGPLNPPQSKQKCNQGVGNGPEACDPGNSNQGNPLRSNDELGGVPGNPGRKGGNKK